MDRSSQDSAKYFASLGRRFGAAQDQLLQERGQQQQQRVRVRLLAGPRRSSRLGWQTLLLPATLSLALVAALVSFSILRDRPVPLSFAVGNSPGRPGEIISSGPELSVPLRFSDGSVLKLNPSGRGRVLATVPHGARVELERGALEASVVHRTNTAWAISAGPFVVAVTGTKFQTEWAPERHELKVTVQEGAVVVSGGMLPAPERVSQGNTLRVVLGSANQGANRTPSWRITASDHATPDTPSQAELAEAQAASVKPNTLGDSRAHVLPAERPASYQAVFDGGSPTDLVRLSETLRSRGDSANATRALLALRSRFPRDPRSALAARTLSEIALGRHDCVAARRWLASYAKDSQVGTAQSELTQRVEHCGRKVP